MKRVYCFIAALMFIGSIAGCGYTTSSSLAGHLKTIHVAPFKNSINYAVEGKRQLYYPLIEVDVREKVVSRFLFDGNLRIAEESDADLVLRGEIINYERHTLRFSDNDDAEEYRAQITVAMELWDEHAQEVVWVEQEFAGEATYFVTGANARSEETAVKDAIDDLARRIVERTIENW